ncbi:GNAT family N-acetyltransferase [Maribacter sp. PR1]|uniref:GNAT family N-acetyltransferase n=1 Tax=Maribacter cobaltidurans TaxID=1178778 RepID=A0ABU7IVX8_9FLAO|nr:MULTISPECIES: GNAT family N-acetyltransferase [Maribacter]MDC6389765.1 GNAT family N-acetyltransferase [Maribacter sp. PR1]MEE1977155.1 GNAT family N-acetyltransferase [Maribacter cobaltidurans]
MKNRKEIIDGILPTEAYNSYFRLVEMEDAEFILSLRNNEKLAKHINPTSTDMEEQINWLKEYKNREKNGKDFYIINLKKDGKTRLGLNRIYNVEGDTFEFGSWLYSPEAGPNDAVLGELFTKGLAFEELGFNLCKMETKKKNTRVLWYAKSYKPKFTGEDEFNHYFESDYENFKAHREKYLKLFNVKP